MFRSDRPYFELLVLVKDFVCFMTLACSNEMKVRCKGMQIVLRNCCRSFDPLLFAFTKQMVSAGGHQTKTKNKGLIDLFLFIF